MKGLSLLSIFILLVLNSSCSQKEEIEPAYAPVKFSAQRGDRPFVVSFPITTRTVEDPIDERFSDIGGVGPVFSELARMLANMELEGGEGQTVPLEPFCYEAYELDQVTDWSVIKELNVNEVKLNVADIKKFPKANLGFISKLKIYLEFETADGVKPDCEPKDEEEKEEVETPAKGFLLLSYDREKSPQSLSGDKKSIVLKVHGVNWKKILKKKRVFKLTPKVIVDEVPNGKFDIGGSVKVSVGLNLDF